MVGKKLSVIMCCLATCWNTSSHASGYQYLVKVISLGDCISPDHTETRERFTLELPKGTVPQDRLQTIVELYIMHPSAFEEFLQSDRYLQPTTQPEHEQPHKTEIAVDQTHSVTEMIDKLENTIVAAKDPASDIEHLPPISQNLLYIVAEEMCTDNVSEYAVLSTKIPSTVKTHTLSNAMKQINYAYQTGTNYAEYLTLDHIISLTSVWLVGHILEQNNLIPIVASDSVLAIMPHIIEAEKIAHGKGTNLYKLLTKLKRKMVNYI